MLYKINVLTLKHEEKKYNKIYNTIGREIKKYFMYHYFRYSFSSSIKKMV